VDSANAPEQFHIILHRGVRWRMSDDQRQRAILKQLIAGRPTPQNLEIQASGRHERLD
jgi:hypothetical protein